MGETIPEMRLVSVYKVDSEAFLYNLLGSRPEVANISHKKMPTWEEHIAFMRSMPYLAWYIIISEEGQTVGAIYLTRAREIGIAICDLEQKRGYGKRALRLLCAKHPGRMLANIAIKNAASVAFFTDQGFKPLSLTLELQENQQFDPILP